MAVEAKRNETRGRKTNIRGDVVICSCKSKHMPPGIVIGHLWNHSEKLGLDGYSAIGVFDRLNFGHALCVVEIYDCIRTDDIRGLPSKHPISRMEEDLGSYSPGRYAWLTRNCRRFGKPFPVRGRQGWFDVPDELVRAALNP